MVDVAAVEALDDELAGEAEVVANGEGLLINVLRREVLRNTAVVRVRELDFVVFMVKEIVHINIVDVALNVFEVDVILTSLASPLPVGATLAALLAVLVAVSVILLFFLLLGLVLVGLLEPGVRENLGHGEALLWFQLDHAADQGLGLRAQLAWEGELALEDELVEVLQVSSFERHRSTQHGEQ